MVVFMDTQLLRGHDDSSRTMPTIDAQRIATQRQIPTGVGRFAHAHGALPGNSVMRSQNEPIKDVYPNRPAPVVIEKDGKRIVREDMLWGFPPFKPGAGYGTNFRTLKIKLWRDWLDREHRCVVPATAFSEPDKNTPKGAVEWRWFERADKLPFFFAGIWRPWTGDRGTKIHFSPTGRVEVRKNLARQKVDPKATNGKGAAKKPKERPAVSKTTYRYAGACFRFWGCADTVSFGSTSLITQDRRRACSPTQRSMASRFSSLNRKSTMKGRSRQKRPNGTSPSPQMRPGQTSSSHLAKSDTNSTSTAGKSRLPRT
jgi:hypothetical protein